MYEEVNFAAVPFYVRHERSAYDYMTKPDDHKSD